MIRSKTELNLITGYTRQGFSLFWMRLKKDIQSKPLAGKLLTVIYNSLLPDCFSPYLNFMSFKNGLKAAFSHKVCKLCFVWQRIGPGIALIMSGDNYQCPPDLQCLT